MRKHNPPSRTPSNSALSTVEPVLTTDTAHFITGANNVFEVCFFGTLRHTWLGTRLLSACQSGPQRFPCAWSL